MLTVIACLLGIAVVVLTDEVLWRKKIIKGENQRKFVHIIGFSFIAFWPWLMSWQTLRFLSILMLMFALLNRHTKTLHYLGRVRRQSYGDIFFALAVIFCATYTDQKLFFTLSILMVSLADGFAAVVGANYGKHWKYKILGQSKTLVGTMTFWLVALFVLALGLLTGPALIIFPDYAYLLIFLPPLLSIVENISPVGADNLSLPIVTMLALHLAHGA
jgi:dolichol kinase